MMVIQTPWQRHHEHNDRGDGQNADEQNTLSSTIHHVAASNPLSTGGRVGFMFVVARETPLVQDRNTQAQTAETFGWSFNFVPSAGTSAANQTYLRR